MTSKTTHERYYKCNKYLTKLNDTSAYQFYFSFEMNLISLYDSFLLSRFYLKVLIDNKIKSLIT